MQYGSSEAKKTIPVAKYRSFFQDPATALNPRMKVLDILRDQWIFTILQPYERENAV